MFLVAFFGCTAIIAFLHIVSFFPPKTCLLLLLDVVNEPTFLIQLS